MIFFGQFCNVIHRCVTAEIIGLVQNAKLTSQQVQLKPDWAGFSGEASHHCGIDCHFSPAFIQVFNIHQENSV